MKEPPGKLKEKIVGIIERHIDHSAKVEVDVFLPVLSDPEMEPRQIDVLISTGTSQRPTYTIVEVQDRQTKPSRLEFDGWLEKMKEVGAQHLICVTKVGYPSSIIKKAKKNGPSVRLFTLKQFENSTSNLFPPTFFDQFLDLVTYEKLVGISVIPAHLIRLDPALDYSAPPDPHYKMFLPYGSQDFVSATEVADWHLFAHPKNFDELPKDNSIFTLKFSHDINPKKPWYLKTLDGKALIKRFEIAIQLRIRRYPVLWEQSKYEQLGHGQVGWLLRGSANCEGNKTTVYVPLRIGNDGLYYAGQPFSESEHGQAFVGYGEKGFKTSSLDSLKRNAD